MLRRQGNQRFPQHWIQTQTPRKAKFVSFAHRQFNTQLWRPVTTDPATSALCVYERYTRRRLARIVERNRTT